MGVSRVKLGKINSINLALVICGLLALILVACGEEKGNGQAVTNVSIYKLANGEKLEEIKLPPELQTGLSSWVQKAPGYTKEPNGSYLLTIAPELLAAINQGDWDKVVGAFRQLDSGKISSEFAELAKLIPKDMSPDIIWNLVSALSAQPHMANINRQLTEISNNLQDIQVFLEQNELSKLRGNLDYLNSIRDKLNGQKLSNDDIDDIKRQLENIERESFQAINFAKTMMERNSRELEQLKQGTEWLGLSRDEAKVDRMRKIVENFDAHGKAWLAALTMRGVAANTRSVLPGSRELPLSRLEDVQSALPAWDTELQKFYELVETKIPELKQGLIRDDRKVMFFAEYASVGKHSTKDTVKLLDSQFAEAITKVKAQVKSAGQPAQVVLEFDGNGQIKKVSKLVKN